MGTVVEEWSATADDADDPSGQQPPVHQRARGLGLLLIAAHLALVVWLAFRPISAAWMADANLTPFATIRSELHAGTAHAYLELARGCCCSPRSGAAAAGRGPRGRARPAVLPADAAHRPADRHRCRTVPVLADQPSAGRGRHPARGRAWRWRICWSSRRPGRRCGGGAAASARLPEDPHRRLRDRPSAH
ncbi:hypothetical protein GXW82_38195 [Streptacidiphilus sp. 4-A2]|nr:hypothetical protein [Streptacidiphilus sp. 4-A2]